ncbi:MAG: hypothetical protein AAFO07_05600 [Bacteroidota bacterium]
MSDSITNRLLSNSKSKVVQARVGLYGMAIVSLVTTGYFIYTLYSRSGIYREAFGHIAVMISFIGPVLFLLLGIFSHYMPKIAFTIGTFFCVFGVLRSTLSFNVIGFVLNLVVGILIYNGISAVRYLEEQSVNKSTMDNILDADLDNEM